MIKPLFEIFSDTQFITTPSRVARTGSYRLDASFYKNKDLTSLAGQKTLPLANLCERVFNPPVFKREFQEVLENGCRYLASSEIISWVPETTYISKEQAKRLGLQISLGWILVTGFGTIGSIRIVDELIEGAAVANNVARIVPKDSHMYSGYIAAFLSSKIGNALLNDRASGSVVRYIEGPVIAEIPIPVLEEDKITKINEKYLLSVKCREEAQKLLRESESLALTANHLPVLNKIETEIFNSDREIEVFLTESRMLKQTNNDGSEYRLDARFYNPLAQLALKNLKACRSEVKPLHEVTDKIILGPRFKRNYVESNHGVPFLSGKNIIQIKPELKYLSNVQIADMQELVIREGWTLITCSGTIGRTCFVWRNYENYAASQHILRVVPDIGKIDPAYLYAFLSSQYGYEQILRYRHGSVIDEITDRQIGKILIPLPSESDQKLIGDKVRSAYEKRAEAIHLEDEAQEILMNELTYGKGSKGE